MCVVAFKLYLLGDPLLSRRLTHADATDTAAGLFLASQLSSADTHADMQRFAAPEQNAASLDDLMQSASAASDVFMLGALTFEMLVGKHAFPAKDDGLGRARRWQVCILPQSQKLTAQTKYSEPCALKELPKRTCLTPTWTPFDPQSIPGDSPRVMLNNISVGPCAR